MLRDAGGPTWEVRRVAIAGASGVGKTTLAATLGAVLGVEPVELDELFHGPNWSIRETFEAEVDEFTRRPSWVTEWQFDTARPIIAARADTMLWLDLPTAVAASRLIRRTVRRRSGRVELWAGNVEPPLWTVFTERNHIIRWGIRTHRKLRHLVPATANEYPELNVVRLRSQAEVDRWVEALRIRHAR